MTRYMVTLNPIVRLFLREQRAALILGMLLSLMTAIAGMALLGISGWFITTTSIAGLSVAAATSLNVFTPSATIRLLAIGRTFARYGERLTTHETTLGILAMLRERLFLGWSASSTALYLRYQPSKLLYRLTADVDALETVYLRILVPAFTALGATAVVAVALGFLHPWLGFASGLWLITTGLGALLVAGSMAGRHARRRAHGIEAIRSRTIDLVAGQTELMMTGQLHAQCAAISKADRYTAQADDALNRLEARLLFIFGCSSTVLVAGTLFAIAMLAKAGLIGTPVAAFGLIVTLTATEQFGPLRRGAMEFGRMLLAARRVSPRLSVQQPDAPFLEPEEGKAFELAAVTACHQGSGRAVLRGVDLALDRGEIVALVGPSGAGKSSLLSLLAGELQAQSGEVRHVGPTLMTQRTELFEGTVRENLLLARPTADEHALKEVLAAAGLAYEIEALRDQLDTRLGEGGTGLSGGQSRRLALARFFLHNTALWLLDEPTEGLDGPTARDVIRRIERQAKGRSVVIATHLRREAAIADHIAIMESGRIIQITCRGNAAFQKALDRLRPD